MADTIIKSFEDAKVILDEMVSKVVTASATRLTRAEKMTILEAVYRIRLSEKDRKKLVEHINQFRKDEGADRGYVFNRSNDYTAQLRYIFPSYSDRSNVSRWSGALTELAMAGVLPSDFNNSVKKFGGLTELYWMSRDRISKRQIRQRLSLDRPIEIIKGKIITLTLAPNDTGILNVLDYKLSDPEFREAAE